MSPPNNLPLTETLEQEYSIITGPPPVAGGHEVRFAAISQQDVWFEVFATHTQAEELRWSLSSGAASAEVDMARVELKKRLRRRRAELLARVRELEGEAQDPVASLIELFGGMPGTDSDWREIVEAPYG